MKRRTVLVGAALLVAVSGCGKVESGGGADAAPPSADAAVGNADASVPEYGSFLVSWNMGQRLGPAPGPIDCTAAGVTTMRVTSEATNGSQVVDLFDCGDSSGETGPLGYGDYRVWVDALANTDQLVARSPTKDATIVGTNPMSLALSFPIDVGFFTATWTLTKNGNPVTCAQVAATNIQLFATTADGNQMFGDYFPCSQGTGTTSFDMPLGGYSVVVSVLDDQDTTLGAAAPLTTSIDYGDETVDLGSFELEIAP